MFKYILLSGVYRFFCGAIILAINWNLATSDNDNFFSLAIAVLISFIPAMFVPVLFSKLFNKYHGPFLTSLALIGVVVSSALLSALYTSNTMLVVINFLIWIFFFVMETTWETWFAGLSKSYNKQDVSKYSSISMTINQVALMSGPIAAPIIIDNFSYEAFFYLMAVTFFAISLFSFFQKVPKVETSISREEVRTSKKTNLYLFFSLALIWPILGSVNFMLPVYVTVNRGEMINVGILDASISIGMALIGIVFSLLKVTTLRIRVMMAFSSIIAGFVIWWISGYSIIFNSVAILLLGFGFGSLRIMIRYLLARNYSTEEVATLVSRANALSLPILGIILSVIMFSIEYTWIAPFFLTIIMSILLAISLRHEKTDDKDNKSQESLLA
ncbi:MFS transporter [Sediminibacillus albus]|uniref:Major Facilitator Superfamily protein n=1 Tax=Sediminibacillus albus TaxID=407036 RepID=A0A1G8YCB9_9BACI|nr:MFS transporter [Sediminibacillus albus]SDK00361.1 Major Facilitator Superfamily protein [Sediminibacillus albus]